MFVITTVGALGADAEVREANGQKFISFNVASTERYTKADGTQVENTTWISCTINGDGGRLLQYLKRGTTVFISGRAGLRIYSSPKERRMMAGANVQVDIIELVGARPDAVPSRLYDVDGIMHDVKKAFYVEEDPNNKFLPKAGTIGVLYSQRGVPFDLNEYGYVVPSVQPVQQTSEDVTAATYSGGIVTEDAAGKEKSPDGQTVSGKETKKKS